MKRYAIELLKNWKKSLNRRPLLIYGARQVGKTWLVRNFAASSYDDLIEINFFTDSSFKEIFKDNLSPKHIILQLEIRFNKKIDPTKTLLFFDEIQESERAMDALKVFNDSAPQYNIIAAGSFLGVMLGRKPVGQTDQITLYPMSFCEFLEAMGYEELATVVRQCNFSIIPPSSHIEFLLKQYFYIGGMPAVVLEYIKSNDLSKVRSIQNQLLIDYKGDFSKHVKDPRTAPKIHILWDSIPLHLFKENKKFMYKKIKIGGRAAEFEIAMQWLIDTGLIYKINKVEKPKMPLKMYFKEDFFKIFMLDIGLFCAKAEINMNILSNKFDLVDDMHGVLAEQFVLQELIVNGITPFYWGREGSTAELDFLIQLNDKIIPIEVKSSKNTKSKSLKIYIKEQSPELAIRTSLKNYGVMNNLHSIPLYMIGSFLKTI